ncbi:MAG: hypothetical protein KKD31_14565, partial [Bacteroidetes bacterium]|nr:hypothetical protein [Bacteroidota bacterium]
MSRSNREFSIFMSVSVKTACFFVASLVFALGRLSGQTFVNNTSTPSGWSAPLVKTIAVNGLPASLCSGTEFLQVDVHMGSMAGSDANLQNYVITLTSPPPSSISISIVSAATFSGVTASPVNYRYTREFDMKFRDNPILCYPSENLDSKKACPWHIGYYKTGAGNNFQDFCSIDPNGTWTLTITGDGVLRFNDASLTFGSPFYINNCIDSVNKQNDDCWAPFCIGSDQINVGSNSGYDNPGPFSDPLNGYGPLDGDQWSSPQVISECPNFYTANNQFGAGGYNAARNNSAWYYFIADSTDVTISLSGITDRLQILAVDSACTATDYHVLDGGCPADPANDTYVYSIQRRANVLSPIYINGSECNQNLNMHSLTVGLRYFLVIDGTGGAISPFYIEVVGAVFCSNCVIAQDNNFTICEGGSDTISVVANGGTQPYTYEWSLATGLSATDVATPEASPATNTTYTVIVTDAMACKDTAEVMVAVNSLPSITVSGDDSICDGEQVTLTAAGGAAYLWSGGETTTSVTVTPTLTTTYTVTGTDVYGCTDTEEYTLTVTSNTNASVSGNDIICGGESTTLTASGGTDFLWSGGETTADITVSPTATTTYTVTVSNGGACSGSATITVTVSSSLTATIAGDSAICDGENTTLTASGGAGFLWSGGETTAEITVSPSVSTAYSVTVSTSGGCSDTETITVTVNANPSATISGNDTICNGQSTTLTASGGTSYLWSGGQTTALINVSPSNTTIYTVTVSEVNGCSDTESYSVIVNANPVAVISGDNSLCDGDSTVLTASGGTVFIWSGGQNTAAITVNPANSVTYTVTVSDANGCSDSETYAVTVNANPTATISGDNSVCNGESTVLTASGGSGYAWSGGQNTAAISVSPTISATYTVTVSDANSCSDTETFSVTVNSNPTASISGTNTICDGQNTTLTAAGGTTYIWSGGQTTASVNVNPSISTTYIVTVSDANNCSDTENYTVNVNPNPIVVISGDNSICEGESTTLIASGGTSYVWSGGQVVASITVNPSVSTGYSVTVSGTGGCSASESVAVTVNPVPTASILGEDTLCNGESSLLTASGGTTFLWSGGQISPSISVHPQSSSSYSVTVTDGNGCSATASIYVRVFETPIIQIFRKSETCDQINGSAWVFVTGGSGTYSYQWNTIPPQFSDTILGLHSGNYFVTVTDGNCATIASTQILNVFPVNAGAAADPTEMYVDENQICYFTDLSTGDIVNWLWNFGDQDNSSLQNPTHLFDSAGNYFVRLWV